MLGKTRTHWQKQTDRGSALVIALFVTALVASIAFSMMLRLHTDTRRTGLILHDMQASLYADGAIKWAKHVLADNWKKRNAGRVTDPPTAPLVAKTPDGYSLHATLEDAQGKFNLNNLAGTDETSQQAKKVFKTLLKQSQPSLTDATTEDITKAVIDWITPGIHNSEYDQYYQKQHPGWTAPHQLMRSISELRLIKHITPALLSQLAPLVTALPNKTPST